MNRVISYIVCVYSKMKTNQTINTKVSRQFIFDRYRSSACTEHEVKRSKIHITGLSTITLPAWVCRSIRMHSSFLVHSRQRIATNGGEVRGEVRENDEDEAGATEVE